MAGMIVYPLIAACVLLSLTFIVVLIRKYLRTRDIGFVWLGVALVVWPMAQGAIRGAINANASRFLSRHTLGTRYQLFSMSLWAVGAALQLVAVLYLHRKKPARN